MRRSHQGFSLIELLILIVVIGVMAAIAMQSMTVAVEDTRRMQTERKLETISEAIVGDPEIMQNGARSDFGYVGDIGAFPPNLAALYTNPGLALWKGPYVQIDHVSDTVSYRTDAWGQAMSYLGGITVTSPGHGSTITKKLCDSASDYLLNTVVGAIRDKNDSLPGAIKKDSVDILVDIPSGASGMVTRTYSPEASGNFSIDSVPAGNRHFRFIYKPANDTLRRYYTVLPRHQGDPQLIAKFASSYFSGGGGGGGCTGSDSIILRPNGAGSITNIPTRSGCPANWQCVDESSPDDNTTYLSVCDNSFFADVYSIENPLSNSCPIVSVTVYCRARFDHSQGNVQPTLYIGGSQYNSASQQLTTSWANYKKTWTTNPANGSAWTWTDIDNLQAGARIDGQNASLCSRLTQVWVVVKY
jgi:prepilin-type N-terminal cleavage/methylation domain-containing protein